MVLHCASHSEGSGVVGNSEAPLQLRDERNYEKSWKSDGKDDD